ncbi:hypothetical protein ART_2680 [Arthrobacter sp. PAMC 25486]|uniref:phosphoribosyltransferase domain-containing protein n=1 Tax=Arthrobacter sp. PAMC 25486 TaxID=1494608 RepID=UPI000535F725|nr:phosphoribosyltransferase domain-containing protein [Arthrobacter sp. PAMC 25486]AIY02279.1 hypothetical protein ART_2680 [Arthrobacter sp. PAMC 25486]
MSTPWRGGFVADRLAVTIHSDPTSAIAVEDLVGLALRRNPKRAHLLVSTVLAKHVPTEPALVMAAGGLLGAFVAHELLTDDADSGHPQSGPPAAALAQAAAALGTALQGLPGQRQGAISHLGEEVAGLETRVPDAVVIGYAETATGLGRLVANALGAYYIHSTRHATPGIDSVAGFEEGHSHATSHAMVPTDPHWLDGGGPVVLVDDEFSTGSTVINTIRELHALSPHDLYVVAALIDLRSAADRARFDALAAELGAKIVVTALGTGWIELGADILDRAAELIRELPAATPELAAADQAAPQPRTNGTVPGSGRLSMLELSGADIAPVRSDRFGNAEPPPEGDISVIAGQLATHLANLGCQGPLVILGCEENMFLPLAVAHALTRLLPGRDVRFSTTTRSPIVPVDRADYAIAGALTFASHDLTNDGPGVRFAYNLNGRGQQPGTIVVFPEPGTNRSAVTRGHAGSKNADSKYPFPLDATGTALPSLADALTAAAGDVVVVLLPVDTPQPTRQPEDAP